MKNQVLYYSVDTEIITNFFFHIKLFVVSWLLQFKIFLVLQEWYE